ncbi:MAG TPA: DUF4198 domain-containing protein [Tepidisphaeraceae bacterium]|nr:DUF4198 domain-containing protein [Tepidisphaeraceae bacterium]
MNAGLIAGVVGVLAVAAATRGHDTWVQTNTNVYRVGDVVHVDLLLGNHGNEHRDFKMAGKPSLADPKATLEVVGPDGKRTDLKAAATDQGLGPKEGFQTARFSPGAAGLYTVVSTSDKVVDYAPKRSVKSAKAFFVASKSLDKVPEGNPGFDKEYGHALELVPLTNPVTPMGPGTKMKVKLLYKGKPMTGAAVSFIPRGVKLAEEFDEKYERKTDVDGVASFEFPDGNYYLVVAHHEDAADKGEKHESTKYSATVCVYVPALCPCCAE